MRIPLAASLVFLLAVGVSAQDGFTDYGVGANVAESRGVVTTQTADGRCLVIANALDESPISYVLVTDIDTGETKQYFCPPDVRQSPPYGSLMHSNGKFYTTQGSIFLEFDPAAGEWTFQAKGSPIGGAYIGFTEGLDGTVWAGSVYQTGLISFNPETRELKDHGRMDPEEKYLNSLATDQAGWVYCGIGTARCNIVAYDPATGEKRSLIAEDQRVTGSGDVNPAADGTAYGMANNQYYLLNGGKATPVGRADMPTRRKVNNIGWGQRSGSFPDGRRLSTYNLSDKWLDIADPKTNENKRIEFDYQAGGVLITSLAEGPNGVVYGSTCHPMHLLALDSNTKTLQDMGPIPQVGGGNFCAIATQGDIVIGAQYSAGRLWAYDVTKPWTAIRSRDTLRITAQDLMNASECKDGHWSYLAGHDIAFLCGDKFGAEGTFKIDAPEDGEYYLHIQPYRSGRYCTVQFLFDGKEIGEPYVATAENTQAGQVQIFGPMDLKAGEHRLAFRTLESKSQEPWFAVCSADLSHEKQEIQVVEEVANPRILGEWHRDICRPRTALAHPDGKHVMMAGYAGYGLCGGGIGIVNLETGEDTLLTADEDLLPSHSCITLKALPNGDLVGGTAIGAPGGGHIAATEAELFILDWQTKKIAFRTVPVPGSGSIVTIQVAEDGLVYGLSGSQTFFVFDPESKEIVHSESFAEYGGVPRHALQLGPDGKLYAIMGAAIVKITPGTFEHEKLADTPVHITAGGALANGLLVFASGSHVWSYQVPGL